MAQQVKAWRLADTEGRWPRQVVRRGRHGPVRVRRILIITAPVALARMIARPITADEIAIHGVAHRFSQRGTAAPGSPGLHRRLCRIRTPRIRTCHVSNGDGAAIDEITIHEVTHRFSQRGLAAPGTAGPDGRLREAGTCRARDGAAILTAVGIQPRRRGLPRTRGSVGKVGAPTAGAGRMGAAAQAGLMPAPGTRMRWPAGLSRQTPASNPGPAPLRRPEPVRPARQSRTASPRRTGTRVPGSYLERTRTDERISEH
jgi:hypothetical protein